MRKDLKIGLAIGAVLLVVLIVYLAIPRHEPGAELAQTTSAGDTASGTVHDEGGSALRETATDTSSGAASGTTEKQPEPPVADASGKSKPADSDVFANEPQNGASTGLKTAAGNSKTGIGEKATASTDWNRLLEGQPLEHTVTPPLRNIEIEKPATPAGSATSGAKSSVQTTGGDTGTADDTKPKTEVSTGTDTGAKTGTEEPAAKPTPATPSGGRTHTIRAGETFASIAKTVYGEERFYLSIQKANPNVDPARMKPGTEITLPEIQSAGKTSAEATSGAKEAKTIDETTEYRVQSGDSLHKIASKRFGTSTMADKIYELNKDKIGNDAAKLKPGMVLKMPPKPASDAPIR